MQQCCNFATNVNALLHHLPLPKSSVNMSYQQMQQTLALALPGMQKEVQVCETKVRVLLLRRLSDLILQEFLIKLHSQLLAYTAKWLIVYLFVIVFACKE